MAKKTISAELETEVSNQPLETSGTIPMWLTGSLLRNGPIKVTVNGESNPHWFDGLAMLHAFSFQNGNVHYTNRFLRSEAYRTVFEKGSLHYLGFAQDPCRSLFSQFLSLFSPHPIQNANINIAKIAEHFVALTEIPLPVRFDPQTLETLGVLDYQDALPKSACWESAHPHREVNYLVKFGRQSFYTLYKNGIEREVIAEIPVESPSYMHSFAITENYIILTEYPLVVNPFDLIRADKPFIANYVWKPERGTTFILIDRKNGQDAGRYKTEALFAFHHTNAFEQGDRIHLDIVAYPNADIINSFYYDKKADIEQPKLKRFTLDLKSGIRSELLLPLSCEFPRINQNFDGKPYRFAYLTLFEKVGKPTGLCKINTETKETLIWEEPGCGEPVFVPTPGAQEEDEGVILAVVGSSLLILDGKSFKEIGRAKVPHTLPPGLHGQYFN